MPEAAWCTVNVEVEMWSWSYAVYLRTIRKVQCMKMELRMNYLCVIDTIPENDETDPIPENVVTDPT
jgi:hypothetical protein